MQEKMRAIIGGDGSMSASAISKEDLLGAIEKVNIDVDIIKEVADEEGLTDEQLYETMAQLEELGIQKVKTATKKKKDKSKTKAKRKQAKKSKQRNR